MYIQFSNNLSLNFIPRIHFGSLKRNISLEKQCSNDCFEKSNFISPSLSKQVYENAKDIVMQSLFDKNPKESIVLIREGEILFHSTGSEFEAEIPDEVMDDILDSGDDNITIIHSHTPESTGVTAPLSLADIENLIENDKINCICAVNNKGEDSIIEKMPGKEYDETTGKVLDNKFCAGFIKLFQGGKKKEYLRFLKLVNESSVQKENETYSSFINRMFTIQDKLDEYYDYATTLKDFPKYTEDFWRSYAKDFGFKYYSNFSF